MVTIITGFVGYFSEFGLIASIIKKQEIDDMDCHTAFWSSVCFSLVVYLCLFISGPLISSFYNQPELTTITRVIAIVFVIGSFEFVPAALNVKKLNYKLINIIQILSTIISTSFSVILAFSGWGVWTLVFQQLSYRFCSAFFNMLLGAYRPKLLFSSVRFRQLYSYGLHMTVNNLIKFFSENIDSFLIGKTLGPAKLGIYSMAFRLTRYPLEKFWQLFGKMLFPAFSSIQKDRMKIRRNYFKITFYGGLVLLPFVIAFFFAIDLIPCILGEKWSHVTGLVRIFCIYFFVLVFSFSDETILSLFNIKLLNILKLGLCFLMLITGYLAIGRWGLFGIAWTYTILFSIYLLVIKLFCFRIINRTMPPVSCSN